MSRVLAASLGLALFLANTAFADVSKQYLCLPLPGTSQPGYSIECKVVNDTPDQSCVCPAGFLLVDRNGPASIGPVKPISGQ